MSVCLHRFYSHRGFRCSRPMAWVLYLLACQAGQGPPLWWAGTHHRYCDTARDPGVIGLRACLFWMYTNDGLVGGHGGYVAEEYPELVTTLPISWQVYRMYYVMRFLCLWPPGSCATYGCSLSIWCYTRQPPGPIPVMRPTYPSR